MNELERLSIGDIVDEDDALADSEVAFQNSKMLKISLEIKDSDVEWVIVVVKCFCGKIDADGGLDWSVVVGGGVVVEQGGFSGVVETCEEDFYLLCCLLLLKHLIMDLSGCW